MGKTTPPPDEPLSRKDVRELIQLIRKNEIQEFELVQGDLKLRIVTSHSNESDPKHNSTSHPSFPNLVYSPPPGYLYPPVGTGYPGMPSAPPASNPGTQAPVAAAASQAGPVSPSTPGVEPAEVEDPNLKKITSPMVGTFYRAPAPDAKPYVDTGARVEEETVLCILEAMKLMNEIKAEMRGIVRRILVENGQPVEYGQPLFLIEPA